MHKKLIFPSILLLPLIFLSAQSINNLDSAPADSNYWQYETSENADSDSGYVNISYVTDQVAEGSGAMQLEYSSHNSEAWGGYSKIYHMAISSGSTDSGSDLEGIWKLSPEAGALKVGPGIDDGSWWASTEDDVITRACYFDDEYVFDFDGFHNDHFGETWIEGWQGGSDACGTPVAPHDGSNAATWEHDDIYGTITISGAGAYLGLPKVINGGELSDPATAPDSVVYTIDLNDDGDSMMVYINFGAGYWTYKMVRDDTQQAVAQNWNSVDNWDTAFDNNWDTSYDWNASFDNGTALFSMMPDDGGVWDWSQYDSISFSYYNSVPQTLEGRVHLRLNLSDLGGLADPSSYEGLGEYYYSFHYILDSDPGWNTISMPLERNDDWAGAGFNLTGWVADDTQGNGELDTDAIGGFHFEFSISGG